MSFGGGPNQSGGLVLSGLSLSPTDTNDPTGPGGNGNGSSCDCPTNGGGFRPESCPPPGDGGGGDDPGGPGHNPDPVPSTGPYSQGVYVFWIGPNRLLPGITITCTETGESKQSACSNVTFYHETTGTKHYSVPASSSIADCFGDPPFDFQAGSGNGAIPSDVGVGVNKVI